MKKQLLFVSAVILSLTFASCDNKNETQESEVLVEEVEVPTEVEDTLVVDDGAEVNEETKTTTTKTTTTKKTPTRTVEKTNTKTVQETDNTIKKTIQDKSETSKEFKENLKEVPTESKTRGGK